MSGIVERNLHRSIVASIIAVEKETGIPASELAEFLNNKYMYVPKEEKVEVEKLKRQMELDVAAEKHARESNLKVNKQAVALTALDRLMGNLPNKFRNEELDTDKAPLNHAQS